MHCGLCQRQKGFLGVGNSGNMDAFLTPVFLGHKDRTFRSSNPHEGSIYSRLLVKKHESQEIAVVWRPIGVPLQHNLVAVRPNVEKLQQFSLTYRRGYEIVSAHTRYDASAQESGLPLEGQERPSPSCVGLSGMEAHAGPWEERQWDRGDPGPASLVICK